MTRSGAMAVVASKAMPNTNRPRLRSDAELRLADLEQRSAASYSEIETVTEDLKQLAVDIDDAVPVMADAWDDTSMVHHVEEVQKRAKTEDD